jgi:hypothetical protein
MAEAVVSHIILKRCAKCGLSRTLDEFPRRAGGKHGRAPYCKPCGNAYYRANARRLNEKSHSYYAEKRAEILRQKQDYAARKKAEIKAAKRARYLRNADEVKRKRNAYHARNKEQVNARRNAAFAADPEAYRRKRREYFERNAEKVREQQQRTRSHPKRRLDAAMRSGVWRLLRPGTKAGRRTYDLLGFTREKLMAHLERLFVDGMTWENYGQAWHVDHVVPLSAHNYQTPDDWDFKLAWALSNLQPLWAKDNSHKRAKLSKPFQPSLLLSERI